MTRTPSWTRIEPDSRSTDPRQGARVPSADPLWLLGRQWWVGEMDGTDGGAPIRAETDVAVEPVVATDRGAGQRPWDRENAPLDAVLAEPQHLDAAPARLALDRGRLLIRVLDDAIAHGDVDGDDGARLRRALTSQFPHSADSPAARRRSATSPRGDELLDGSAILAHVRSTDGHVLAEWAVVLERWLALLGIDPETSSSTPDADPFRLAARSHDVTLHGADGSRAQAGNAPGPALRWDDLAISGVGTDATFSTRTSVPSRTVFEGQPPPRWWTSTDASEDWVTAPAGPTDLPRLVVIAAFAEQGTDWWLVPVQVPTDAFVHVSQVRLFDGFGEAVTALPVDDSAMRLWEAGAGAGVAVCLAGTPSMAGDPAEETELRPDDLRNLVWAVERIVPDDAGRGIRRATAAEPRDVPRPQIVLRTPTPPGWIPYRREPGSDDLVQVPLTSAEGQRTPRGVLAPPRLAVRREDLPPDGIAVRRTDRLARSHGGARRVWVARTATDAATTGGPGLRHDVIERPEP